MPQDNRNRRAKPRLVPAEAPFNDAFRGLAGKFGPLRESEGAGRERTPARPRPPAKAVIRLEKKGRAGKEVTVIEQLDLSQGELSEWRRDRGARLGPPGQSVPARSGLSRDASSRSDQRAEMIASVNSAVFAVPPRSRVRTLPSAYTLWIARSKRSASLGSSIQRSIITVDIISAVGLARPLPAMSGAVPWTASKIAQRSPRFAPGTTPRPPTSPAHKSDTMSP